MSLQKVKQSFLPSRFVPLAMFPAIIGMIAIGVSANQTIASEKQKAPDPNSNQVVDIDLRVSSPTMLAGSKETNYLRVSLKGFDVPKSSKRPPVNVAIVIDNSGSMNGTKIQQARQAAIAAVDRLGDDDIVSVVLYNSTVEVLVPATKASDRALIKSKIGSVQSGGGTALFAGVSKGAAEVRKFQSSDFVNRVILLSDGKANQGPSSPAELERLGVSFVKEGISVSTLGLGLGYNEDLMAGLAAAGSGNHVFVEEAQDLIAVFNDEFSDLMSVVANEFSIKVTVDDAVRPVRVLGTKADIVGQDIFLPLGQLYARQERYFVIAVEVSEQSHENEMQIAKVDVKYNNLVAGKTDEFTGSASVKFSVDEKIVDQDRDLETLAYCSVQIANERNRRATALRDAGQIDFAKGLLQKNAIELSALSLKCAENNVESVLPELKLNITLNEKNSDMIEEKDWNRNRKSMRASQQQVQSQQKSFSIKGGISSSSSKKR